MAEGSSQDAWLNAASPCQGACAQEAQGLLAAAAERGESHKVLGSVFRRVTATVMGAVIAVVLGAGLWQIRGPNSMQLRGQSLPRRTELTQLAGFQVETDELVQSLWRMRKKRGNELSRFLEEHPQNHVSDANDAAKETTPVDKTSFQYRYSMGQCFLTVYQSALVIGIATLDMAAAAKLCKPNEDGDVAVDACGGVVSDFFTEIMDMASFVALAPSLCGLNEFAHSWCASDMFWFLSNVGNTLVSSFSYRGDCWSAGEEEPEAPEAENATSTSLWPTSPDHFSFHSFARAGVAASAASERSLRSNLPVGTKKVAKLPAEVFENSASDEAWYRDLDIANCAIMAQQLAAMLADLGLNAAGTVRDCKLVAEEVHTELDRQVCASDVLNLVALVADFVSYVGGLLGACPKVALDGAWCTSDVATGVGALTNFAAWGAAITSDCNSEVGWPKGPGNPDRTFDAEQRGGSPVGSHGDGKQLKRKEEVELVKVTSGG